LVDAIAGAGELLSAPALALAGLDPVFSHRHGKLLAAVDVIQPKDL
jgi:hypothetical protein